MKRYVKPETVNILGGGQAAGYQANRHSEHQDQPEAEPSQWEKFKIKAKNTWKAIVEIARDIKDTIIPIVSGLETLLVGLAAFRSRNNQDKGCTT